MEPIKFNLSSRAAAPKRTQPQQEEAKDFINEISGNKIVSVAPVQTRDGPFVIPLAVQGQTKRSKSDDENNNNNNNNKSNNLNNNNNNNINKNNNNTNNNINNNNVTPETKSLDQIAAEAIMKDVTMAAVEAPERSVPLTVQNQIEGLENITDEEERFKYDLNSRPDEADSEAYESMPIDEFGFAMLRGMGWSEGSMIGLNNRGLVEPIEFVKRPGYRLGLGATPKDLPVKTKKYIKPGESREPAPIMVAQAGPDGKVRHVKSISEKLVPLKKGLQPGQLVGIVSGPHEGLYARIVQAGEDDEIVVRLQASDEDLVVSKSDVSVVDLNALSDGHPALKFMIKERKARERDEREEKDSAAYHKKDKSDNYKDKDYDKKSSSKSSSSKSDSSSASSSWLRPRIMVRVVSKSFHNGKYYNKKVRIYDVSGHNECIVQLDNGSLVDGVKQRMLETVIPQAGGKVMIVEGVDKGKVGTLMERTKKGKEEIAIVQMISDLSITSFSLDDVAQYVGTYDEEAVDINV